MSYLSIKKKEERTKEKQYATTIYTSLFLSISGFCSVTTYFNTLFFLPSIYTIFNFVNDNSHLHAGHKKVPGLHLTTLFTFIELEYFMSKIIFNLELHY